MIDKEEMQVKTDNALAYLDSVTEKFSGDTADDRVAQTVINTMRASIGVVNEMIMAGERETISPLVWKLVVRHYRETANIINKLSQVADLKKI
jgi:hypothetical protein